MTVTWKKLLYEDGIAAVVAASATKAVPASADVLPLIDSGTTTLRKLPWSDLETALDALYAPITHATQHGVGQSDTVFPADPNADKYLMWNDVPGQLVWAIPSGGHVIQDEGTPLAAEPNLDFTGAGVTVIDVLGSSKTLVTISGGVSVLEVQVFS